MNCIMENFISEETCPSNWSDVNFFTEILLHHKFKIPSMNPPIEKVIDIKRNFFIKEAKPVPIPHSNSKISSVKILVTGFAKFEIIYSANIPEQDVHLISFEVPFEAMVTCGNCQKPIDLQDCKFKKFKVHICVEHLEIVPLNPHKIETTAGLLIWLEDLETCCTSNLVQNRESKYYEYLGHVSTEIATSEIIVLSGDKPKAKKVLNSIAKIKINKAQIINTPKVYHFLVRKVIVIGKALLTVKYVADEPGNQIYTASFSIPFKALIDWPGGPPENAPIQGSIAIEKNETELLDECHLLNFMVLRLDIIPK